VVRDLTQQLTSSSGLSQGKSETATTVVSRLRSFFGNLQASTPVSGRGGRDPTLRPGSVLEATAPAGELGGEVAGDPIDSEAIDRVADGPAGVRQLAADMLEARRRLGQLALFRQELGVLPELSSQFQGVESGLRARRNGAPRPGALRWKREGPACEHGRLE